MPFRVESAIHTNIGGAASFTVTASQKDDAQNSLQVGALWVYAGSNFISDSFVFHGPVVNEKVAFNFQVRTNYLVSSWFTLHYGTTKTWQASYSFYLKDFSPAR